MGTILDALVASARERVATAKSKTPLREIITRAEQTPLAVGEFAFEKALTTQDVAFICECKKASPSKGVIASEFPYLKISQEYEAAGADCVSVLTEPTKFLGADDYLREIATVVNLPCLRKDFFVDEYMIYEAKTLGASAVLLICSILDDASLRRFLETSDSLGLSALVEAHNEEEVRRALQAGARIVGVNNRNLKDFSVDTTTSARLREIVGSRALFVAESGIQTPQDVELLRAVGVDAILVGETLMRSSDKRATLRWLKGTA